MGVVLLQILQWILRIILFLLILLFALIAIVLIVPIRYRAEGEFLEKKPGVRGKITWFFYLIYMKFAYEKEFHIMVRVFGFKVYDSDKEATNRKKNQNSEQANDLKDTGNETEENVTTKQTNIKGLDEEQPKVDNLVSEGEKTEYNLEDLEKEMEKESEEEVKLADEMIQNQTVPFINEEENVVGKEKVSLSEKIEGIKRKVQDIIQKIKNIITKIQEGKLKAEHYLELWNRKETQVTFGRAKTKLGRMIKAVLPRKWNVTGEVGFADPSTTGQFIGILGAMYPIIGSHVQMVPDFEHEVMNMKGNVKGHIRLGNLLFQLVSLILNIHCFKFIKLVLDEFGGSKKSKKQINSKKNKKET